MQNTEDIPSSIARPKMRTRKIKIQKKEQTISSENASKPMPEQHLEVHLLPSITFLHRQQQEEEELLHQPQTINDPLAKITIMGSYILKKINV